MRVIDMLDEQKHANLLRKYRDSINRRPNNKTQNKSNSERLTERDMDELMGVHRDTYHKVKGRVKRK